MTTDPPRQGLSHAKVASWLPPLRNRKGIGRVVTGIVTVVGVMAGISSFVGVNAN